MKKQFQLTQHGKRELEDELRQLIDSRADIANKIAEAREFGDLSENAEYSAAREEQGRVETRIAEIENILKNAEIIKEAKKGTIGLGSTVELKNGKTVNKYKIVGSVEADPLNGKISDESPLGKQLIGKKVGDTAVITTPKGETKYSIVSVE
ncbi:MAG: transcription elongation factor GreA [Candidatus Nomurabacteria bacterium]|jgi:transcription elongation factor GreA|nr:transcription elongation factor GreA [Candidatus Nomurabacteria bacterium]